MRHGAIGITHCHCGACEYTAPIEWGAGNVLQGAEPVQCGEEARPVWHGAIGITHCHCSACEYTAPVQWGAGYVVQGAEPVQ